MTKLQTLIEKLDLKFEKLTDVSDGWYLWRMCGDGQNSDYAFVECRNGLMLDFETEDNNKIVVECAPYGEFAGPIIDR